MKNTHVKFYGENAYREADGAGELIGHLEPYKSGEWCFRSAETLPLISCLELLEIQAEIERRRL